MDTSILIGRLISAVYIAVGLGLLIRPKHYRAMFEEFMGSPALLYLGGITALLVGLLIVLFHNVWTGGWIILLTVIGWMALLKGVLLLVLPDLFAKQTEWILDNPKIIPFIGIFALALGVGVGYLSCSLL